MMFRFMQPDSQCLYLGKPVHELGYVGAYVPIKNMGTNRIELARLEGHGAEFLFNEHVLCVYVLEKITSFLAEASLPYSEDRVLPEELKAFYDGTFRKHLTLCNCVSTESGALNNPRELFKAMSEVAEGMSTAINAHIKQLSYSKVTADEYSGPLCGYQDFLFPVLKGLRRLKFMPDGPIYLLIDDADNLNLAQTKVLNSWVSTRTHAEVSIKISTQLRYKTFRTFSGQTVDTPHDYSEVNISTLYTSHKKKYYDRLREIVARRLNKAKIASAPEEFFPEDQGQVKRLEEIRERLKVAWESGKGIGYRASDDVTRYARPDLIKSLGGTSKSTPSYSYSGFEQLVHLSSGIIRHFLEPASKMYSVELSLRKDGTESASAISPAVQNSTIREWAKEFLFGEMDRLRRDEEASSDRLTKLERLSNLLDFLGGTFSAILNSTKTERRVFSIAFSNSPDKEVLDVLKLGVEEGFFHESTIGNKEGTGRTRLFVMSRRLAPCFNLDPTSFAGYLFVTNEKIRRAMEAPHRALRELSQSGADDYFSVEQLSLFE
jgi:hypothetical protein